MRRRRLVLALAALALALGGAGCGEEERDVTGTPDFTVEVPEGWEQADEDTLQSTGSGAISMLEEAGQVPEDAELPVEYLAIWFGPDSDEFRSNINVFREPLGPVGREEYLRFSAAGVEQFTGSEVERRGGPAIDGLPSVEFVYSGGRRGPDLAIRTLTVFREGHAYGITLTVSEDLLADGESALDQLVSSWSWN